MKALVHTAPLQFDFRDVSQPEPMDDEVLVRVKACGICGSDVHGYTGSTGRRIPPKDLMALAALAVMMAQVNFGSSERHAVG